MMSGSSVLFALSTALALASAAIAAEQQAHSASARGAGTDRDAEQAPDAPPPPGNAKSGRQIFQRVGCYQCHGTSGEGAGQFGPKVAPDPLPFLAYQHQLRNPRMLMPIYTARILPDQDAADIYAYLAAIPKAKAPAEIPLLNR